MPDERRLKSIASRYNLEIDRHPDPWRKIRSRLSYIFALGTIAACIPWLLGDHRAFQAGCVSDAHRAFGQNCQSCHDRQLVPLRRMITLDNTLHSTSDKKCQVCHRQSNSDHLSPQISDDHPLLAKQTDSRQDAPRGRLHKLEEMLTPQFSGLGCAGCHQEHRGNSILAHVADANCANCHQQAHQQISPRRFQLDFADFRRHPEFAIWRDEEHAESEFGIVPKVKSVNGMSVDQAAIRFSHHRHLNPQLLTPNGKATSLHCADCHQTDSGGAYFRPIYFEHHCNRCHKLGFPTTGELPHATPEIIHGILLDGLAKNWNKQPPAATDRLGGPTKPPLENVKVAAGAAPDLASLREKLGKLERQLFDSPQVTHELPQAAALLETACNKCHFTESTKGVAVAWKVVPTRIPSQWMEHGRFRHDRHLSVDCGVCHTRNGDRFETVNRDEFYAGRKKNESSIYASRSAQDVLMPRIDVCRQCHNHDSASSGRALRNDRCVDCHAFHHTPTTKEASPGIGELLKADRSATDLFPKLRPGSEADR